MNFQITHLMNSDDIDLIASSQFPNEKATVIVKGLSKYCFISKFMLYIIENNVTYTASPMNLSKAKLITMITYYLQKSYQNLSEDKQQLLKYKNQKTFTKMFENSSVETYYNQIVTLLEKNDVIFDDTPYQIHFNNGYFDLKDKSFKERILHTHYITKFIKRDYSKSSKKERNEMMSHIRKIYPDDEDLKCILTILGSALTGKSNVDQDTLFLLGKGSAGKSFIMELSQKTFECYFKELKNDTFSNNNSKIDKILNSFANNPQIRITWVNEIKDVKIDETLFKKFCEGKLQTTKLYQDESQDIIHNSKAFITANTMIGIKVDTGVARRFKGYTHQSKFVDGKNEKVDESNHKYLMDQYLLENIVKSNNLLNAWFDILAEYSYKWIGGEKPNFSKNFTDTKDSVLNSNDILQDFIDGHLVVSPTSKDRISKNDMELQFKKVYPDKHLSTVQLITSLKDKGLNYNPSMRVHGVRGCFTHIKLKVKKLVGNAIQPNDCRDYMLKIEEDLALAKEEIEKLRQQLLEAQQPKPSNIKIKKVKKVKKVETDNESNTSFTNDDIDDIVNF